MYVATIKNIAIVHSMQMDQPDDYLFYALKKRNQAHAFTYARTHTPLKKRAVLFLFSYLRKW